MSQAVPASPDFHALFDAAPGSYLVLSSDFTIVGVNDCYLQATMTRREEIVGRGLFEVFPDNPGDPTADGARNLRASLDRVLAEKRPHRMPVQKYDIRRPPAQGGGFEERHWSPLNTPVLDSQGEVSYIIHWVEDVTEFVRLKRQMHDENALLRDELNARATKIEAEVFLRGEAVEANQQLTERSRRYRFLADLVPQLIWTTDETGAAEYFNERWVEFTHLTAEELRASGWQQAIHPEDRDSTLKLWEETIRGGAERYQVQHRLRRHDGTYRWMFTTALPYRDPRGELLRWFGSTTDIHEKVLADEKLQQVQRLQAAGQLAGGVAHEVNNMMTIVMGCGHYALEGLGADHPQRPEVAEMIKAASRASEVTRQLLAYSRQQVLRLLVLDLNDVLSELTPALIRLVGSDRQLAVRHSPSQIFVRTDRGQLEQVLINLVANARDATSTGGVVRIGPTLQKLDRATLNSLNEPALAAGDFVRISVEDNGVGMPPEVAARVFEPFFTTKAVGEGTGLGLSMVYGIVKQSGGVVEIESRPGEGTVVSVFLPLTSEEVIAQQTPSTAVPGEGERILVVEDSSQVRALARRVLQEAGYVVYEAPTGLAALDFLAGHAGEIDLVITDVVMPGLNGRELADHLRISYPEVPILFMSGYSGAEIQKRGLLLEQGTFIQKPFTPETLAFLVGNVLAQSPEATP